MQPPTFVTREGVGSWTLGKHLSRPHARPALRGRAGGQRPSWWKAGKCLTELVGGTELVGVWGEGRGAARAGGQATNSRGASGCA